MTAARSERPFLTAEWRDLVMLNYRVAPALLERLVPAGTELDSFDGTTFLSVVGFRFLDTRVLGFSLPGHRDFEEVNLRFYVRRRTQEGLRRGVVFIRELVPRRLIAWVARAAYNEPYRALPMRHQLIGQAHAPPREIRYEWRSADRWDGLSADFREAPRHLEAGSEAEFVTEHFWGYTRQRDGSTIEYRVSHPSWRVRNASTAELRGDLVALYGRTFADACSGPPSSAFWAEGSPVVVYRPVRFDG